MRALPSRVGLLSVALLVVTVNQPQVVAHPLGSSDATWIPGLYNGWVYFEAKTDWSFHVSQAGLTSDGDGVKFYVSHGDINCQVTDQVGTGSCFATFPMDVLWTVSAVTTTPNCTSNYQASARADAIDLAPLMPLTVQPLADGFSQGFNPATGPASGTAQETGCAGFSAGYTIPPGMPKWPDLDFRIDFHSPLSIGGTCSMEGLPRSGNAGFVTSTLSLDSCEWRAYYIDPYATLP
jgi:hypothetical protein